MAADGPVVAQGHLKLSADGADMVSSLTGQLNRLGGPLGQIANMGRNVAGGLTKSFDGARPAVNAVGIGLGLVGVAALGFAVKASGAFVDVGKEVLKLQRYTGGSAEEMSKWRYAAQQSGVDADKLAKGLGFLSKNLESGKVNFGAMGVATVDTHGKLLPLDQILLNVADKFKSLPNGAEKTADAIKIFGKSGADLIPMLNKGRDGLVELQKEAQKYGLVLTGSNLDAIKKSIAAHREQTAAMQGLKVQIGSQVLPVMTQLTQSLTTGLLVAMPAITAIIHNGVLPAFSAVAGVVSGASHFMSEHAGLVKTAGAVIGSVLVPALVAWGVAQARVLVVNLATSLSGIASAAVRAATSMGIFGSTLEHGAASFTVFNAVALAGYAAIGLVIMKLISDYQRMQNEAKAAAGEIVKSATSPQDAIAKLTAKQAEYHKEMGGGITILGLHLFATDKQAKSAATAAAGYKATSAALQKLNDDQKAAVEAAAVADDATTKTALAIEQMGSKTHLTADQIQELAAKMNLNLEKATPEMIQQLAEAAVRLDATSESALKLADAHKILGDWTQDITKKTSAFTEVLNVSVSGPINLANATQHYKDSLTAVADKVKAASQAIADAHRHEQDTMQSLTDAVLRRTDAEKALQDLLNPSARTKEQAGLDLSDATHGLTRAQIDVRTKQAALDALKATGTAAADQLASANLDLADAQNNVVRSTEHLSDAQAAVNALTPEGIVQSQAYAQAQKNVGDAQRAVADAQAAHTAALAAAAQTEKDHADRVAELGQVTRDVVLATQAQIEADVNLTGNFKGAGAIFAAHVADMRSVLAAAGLTKGEIQALTDKYLSIPAQVNGAVNIDTGQAEANVNHLKSSLADLSAAAGASMGVLAGNFFGNAFQRARPAGMSEGGVFHRRTTIDIGEAGDEMALPLDKPDRARQLIGSNTKARALFGNYEPPPGVFGGASGGSSRNRAGGGFGGDTYVTNHYAITVEGSITTEGQFIDKVRAKMNTYNGRAGERR